MRRTFTIAAALFVAALSTTAFAQDTQTTEDRFYDKVEAVATASWPLLVQGAELCQTDTAYRTGLRYAYFSDDASGKKGGFVTAIAKGSPADKAGVKRGDAIVSINGEKVDGLIPGRSAARLDKLIDDAADAADPVSFALLRGGQSVTAAVTPVEVCDLKVEYLPVQAMFSPKSGDTVIVSDLMFNVAESDWQRQAFLASDVAYAMSKTASRNSAIKKAAGFAGGLLGAVTGVDGLDTVANLGTSFGLNKDQALKADRVSLYLLARAGVDVTKVPGFWRTVYAYPESAKWSKTYFGLRPTLDERNAVFSKTLTEIKDLQARGQPLLPSST